MNTRISDAAVEAGCSKSGITSRAAMRIALEDALPHMQQAAAPAPQHAGEVQGDALTDAEIDESLNALYRHLLGSGQHNGGMCGVAWDRAVYRAALAARQTAGQVPVGTIRDRGGVFEIELSESAHDTDAGALDGRSVYLSPAQAVDLWQPIETAPKNGSSMLLGHFNSAGKWRTVRGRWFSGEHIEMEWENADGFEDGWYEESVEADDSPNVWPTTPTHWQPLPAAPFYSKAVQS